MPLSFVDHDGDASAKFLISFFDHPRLGIEPGIEAAADVKNRNVGIWLPTLLLNL